jgi:predicted kinase
MRRLPDELMLDYLVREGSERMNDELAADLARRLAEFHRQRRLSRLAGHRAGKRLWRSWEDSLREARELEPLAGPMLSQIRGLVERFRDEHGALVEERHHRWTVDGHGDLRAEHVCLTQPPVFFDCLEFSADYRQVDAANDLAFLLMDLEALGARQFAGALGAHYLYETRDETLPLVLDFYRSHRALIRARVAAIRAREGEIPLADRTRARQEAARLLTLSRHYLRPTRLIVVYGYSGTGKSSVASRLASAGGMALLGTDVIRREVVPASGPAPFLEGRYGAAARARVYDELVRRALQHLLAGNSVVLDGTFLHDEGQDALTRLRADWDGPALALLVDPGQGAVAANLRARSKRADVSDADAEVYRRQLESPLPDVSGFWRWRLDRGECGLSGAALLARLPSDFAPLIRDLVAKKGAG